MNIRWLFFISSCLPLLVLAETPTTSPQRLVAPLYEADNLSHDNYYYYYSRLLHLALDRTVDEYGPYELETPQALLVDNRLKASIIQGNVDIAWFTTTADTERQLRAVKVPLLGEINHYRLLLIRSDDQLLFAEIDSLEDLRELTGGISEQWPDAAVMEANDLSFVSASGYDRLFRMLSAGRFDYFSRGLYQIFSEIEAFPHLNLAVEQELMLAYPSYVYFFVHRDNKQLAERIEKGLLRARADGSWDALFNSIPRFQRAQEELKNHQRRILSLQPAATE